MQRREFDNLRTQDVRRVAVAAATAADLPELIALGAKEISALAAAEPAIMRVWRHNPENILAFRRRQALVGVYSLLHLNRAGLERLLVGELDTADPNTRWLALPGEESAAVYSWAVVCRGIAAEGMHSVSARLDAPPYRTANLYARPTSAEAVRLSLHMGYEPVQSGCPGLYRYLRLCNRLPALSMAA